MMKRPSENNEEFLPAALEILEQPPSPLGRILMLVIAALFTTIVAWSYLGKVDVVVTGQGKVIPSGQVKTVQPFEPGVVTAIHVSEGQLVNEGDLLIELDPTDTISTLESLQAQIEEAELDFAVAQSLLSEAPGLTFDSFEFADQLKAASARNQMLALLEGHLATLGEFEAEKKRLAAQLDAANIEIQKAADSIPILEERVNAAGTLLARDAVRQDDRLSLQQSLIEMRANKANLEQTIRQLTASLEGIGAQRDRTNSNFLANQRAAEREAVARINDLKAQITAQQRRKDYRSLVSPVSGFIDQLTTFTIGGVVNAGQPVMNIVPIDAKQEIEAFILNKDIGFVTAGDPAEIKLEAFPFTKYGVLDGTVKSVSNDAIAHEQFGLVYKVKADIHTPSEALEDIGVTVGPGMNVTLEVITEKRRIIDFFISPLLRYKDEAIRER